MKFDFTLTGRTALLMHQDSVLLADELDAWRKDSANRSLSKAGDDRSPAWTWQTYCYAPEDDGSGKGRCLAMPAENIMACLRKAGAQLILKKQKTFKEATQSGLLLDSEFCKFFVNGKEIPVAALDEIKDKTFAEQSEAVKKLGFSLFVKRAVIGKSKHVRVRPRFPVWSVKATVHVLVPEITKDVLKKLLELAGSVGLGDWRPGGKTPGSFGMFDAVVH